MPMQWLTRRWREVFAMTLALAALVWGAAGTAKATDQPPVITNFTVTRAGPSAWTFSGQVTDDTSVKGLTVNLGGIPSLEGINVTTNAQGWFTYTCTLGPNDSGTATAQTHDTAGLASNVAMCIVN